MCWTVLTGGIYFLFWYTRECCYRTGCMTPRFISMVRGKMAVTSHGRYVVPSNPPHARHRRDANSQTSLYELLRQNVGLED